MQKRTSEHFEVYFEAASPAEQDIEKIIRCRETAYAQIACTLRYPRVGLPITLVLYADAETKYKETGHRGNGWGFETFMVEIYNESVKVSPYHELTHVVAGALGTPPALYDEGLAVYLSNLLSATPHATERLDEQASAILAAREWIPIDELAGYAEIGPAATRPSLSYAVSAAFVKHLIETYGIEGFLRLYSQTGVPRDPAADERNRTVFCAVYGKTLAQVEQELINTLIGPHSRQV